MDLVGFFKTVGHDIKAVAIKAKNLFVSIFGSQAAQEFGSAALGLLKSALGQIVVAEVQTLAGDNTLTGVDKAAQAQASILKQAETAGITVSKSIVNMLIELAVQFISGNLATVAKTTGS